MRLLPTLLLAATTAYAADTKALLDTILTSLGGVATLTKNVTGMISDLDGKNVSTALPIQTATDNLVKYINNATVAVNKYDFNLTTGQAQTLGPYTQELAYTVNASIATLIGKKPAFLELSLGGLVVTSLQGQINASNHFSKAILSRVPYSLYSVSVAINSQISGSLQQGLSCFQGMNETCNANVVNASRTMQAAEDTGAIPKSAGGRSAMVAGWMVVLGAAFVAFATGV